MGVTVVTLQALESSANLSTSASEAQLECALCSQNMYQLPFSWHQVTKWITAVIGKSGFREARSGVLSLAAGVLHQVELKEERGRARAVTGTVLKQILTRWRKRSYQKLPQPVSTCCAL